MCFFTTGRNLDLKFLCDYFSYLQLAFYISLQYYSVMEIIMCMTLLKGTPTGQQRASGNQFSLFSYWTKSVLVMPMMAAFNDKAQTGHGRCLLMFLLTNTQNPSHISVCVQKWHCFCVKLCKKKNP